MVIRTVPVVLALVLLTLPASGQVAYDRTGQRLSVAYNGTPLREVLSEVSRKTGIIIYVDPAVDKTVFIDRKMMPVDEVLNEIIKPLNNMLIYRGSEVQAVRIYQQSPADAMQKIEPGMRRQPPPPDPSPAVQEEHPNVRERPRRMVEDPD